MEAQKRLFFTVNEVTEILDISRKTKRAWRYKGLLPAPKKFGKTVLYRRDSILKLGKTPQS